MHYTGIGSRSVDPQTGEMIKAIAFELGKQQYTLRSGGADGCDTYFEYGCDRAEGKKDIFLPWPSFNKRVSKYSYVDSDALNMVRELLGPQHWNNLSQGAQKLHARNCYQVLGYDLKMPSKFLICWTPNGDDVGGSRTAILLARKHNIPIYNLGNKKIVELFIGNWKAVDL